MGNIIIWWQLESEYEESLLISDREKVIDSEERSKILSYILRIKEDSFRVVPDVDVWFHEKQLLIQTTSFFPQRNVKKATTLIWLDNQEIKKLDISKIKEMINFSAHQVNGIVDLDLVNSFLKYKDIGHGKRNLLVNIFLFIVAMVLFLIYYIMN